MARPIEEALKDILKAAAGEVLQENRDLLREIVDETIEEIALSRAIDKGLRSDPVSREDVFAICS